jgi:hypothetical protein
VSSLAAVSLLFMARHLNLIYSLNFQPDHEPVYHKYAEHKQQCHWQLLLSRFALLPCSTSLSTRAKRRLVCQEMFAAAGGRSTWSVYKAECRSRCTRSRGQYGLCAGVPQGGLWGPPCLT